MKKLLTAETKRRLTFPLLWLEILAIILLNYYNILQSGFGFTVTSNSFLYENAIVLCILITLNCTLHLRGEREYGTLSAKMYLGYSKKSVYLAESIISVFECLLLWITDIAATFICCAIAHYDFEITPKLFITAFSYLALLCSVSQLTNALSMTLSSHALALLIIVAVTALLIYYGTEITHGIIQPKRTDVFFMDGKMHDNPLYISGAKRFWYKLELMLSPYTQACYLPHLLNQSKGEITATSFRFFSNLLPYHMELIFINVLECFLFTFIGKKVFQKRDLQ